MASDSSPFKGVPYDPKKYGRNDGNTGPAPPFAHWYINFFITFNLFQHLNIFHISTDC